MPLSARDVVFTYKSATNPANALPAQSGYDAIASVSAPSRYVVSVTLKRPYAPIVATFFGGDGRPILPAHLLEKYANLNAVPFNTAPIGSGPYRVASWKRGDRLELVANDRYFAGTPKIAHLSIRSFRITQRSSISCGMVKWTRPSWPVPRRLACYVRFRRIRWSLRATVRASASSRLTCAIRCCAISSYAVRFRKPWIGPRSPRRRRTGCTTRRPECAGSSAGRTTRAPIRKCSILSAPRKRYRLADCESDPTVFERKMGAVSSCSLCFTDIRLPPAQSFRWWSPRPERRVSM